MFTRTIQSAVLHTTRIKPNAPYLTKQKLGKTQNTVILSNKRFSFENMCAKICPTTLPTPPLLPNYFPTTQRLQQPEAVITSCQITTTSMCFHGASIASE